MTWTEKDGKGLDPLERFTRKPLKWTQVFSVTFPPTGGKGPWFRSSKSIPAT
jgi:hypothetical protein